MALSHESLKQPRAEEPPAPPQEEAAVEAPVGAKPEPRKRSGKKPEPSVFVAITSGVAEFKGESAVYVKDVTRVAAGHWLLKRVPDSFEPAEEHVHYGGDEKAVAEKRGG